MDQPGWAIAAATGAVLGAAVISSGLIVALRPWLVRFALAKPNARSSHRVPTPQGGGIGVVAATLVCAVVAGWTASGPAFWTSNMTALVLGTLALAAVGALDDAASLAISSRLACQTAAVIAVVVTLPGELRLWDALPIAIERAALVVGGLWFVNLMNFMDGIDWMTVAETVPLTATLVVLGCLGALPSAGLFVAAALLGAVLGFAPFNRPVARLFLGDVGSLPLGLLVAWLLILLAGTGHVIAALVLPLYYLADASITLGRRLVAGERVWEAHRQHFYQRAVDRGMPVGHIVALVFLTNVALGGLALLSVLVPSPTIGFTVAGVSALLVLALLRALARGIGTHEA